MKKNLEGKKDCVLYIKQRLSIREQEGERDKNQCVCSGACVDVNYFKLFKKCKETKSAPLVLVVELPRRRQQGLHKEKRELAYTHTHIYKCNVHDLRVAKSRKKSKCQEEEGKREVCRIKIILEEEGKQKIKKKDHTTYIHLQDAMLYTRISLNFIFTILQIS